MKVQVLIVTLNQPKGDYSLLEKMNIHSDAIVCNQCDRNEVEEIIFKGSKIMWYSFNEKGVGLNRNNGLMRSDADICILADDDMVFRDGYPNIVLSYYENFPKYDVILFNLLKNDSNFISKSVRRVTKFNYGKYGAARITFRNNKIKLYGIFFNTLFGGGCQYSCGEDTLFLYQCLNNGIKMIEVPDYIAKITNDRKSTWFEGYNDKFFFDKGVLYYTLNRNLCWIYALVYCFKHRYSYKEYGMFNALYQMYKGIKYIKGKGIYK